MFGLNNPISVSIIKLIVRYRGNGAIRCVNRKWIKMYVEESIVLTSFRIFSQFSFPRFKMLIYILCFQSLFLSYAK